jgi:hypothetical protein
MTPSATAELDRPSRVACSDLLNEAASGDGDWELWFTGLIVLRLASIILPVHE